MKSNGRRESSHIPYVSKLYRQGTYEGFTAAAGFDGSAACASAADLYENAEALALESFMEASLPPNTLLLWLNSSRSCRAHLLRHLKYELQSLALRLPSAHTGPSAPSAEADLERGLHSFAASFLAPLLAAYEHGGCSTNTAATAQNGLQLAVRPFLVSNLDRPLFLLSPPSAAP